METIGYQLRAARARKSLTVDQAAQATKVKLEYLLALEADKFDEIPAPIYVKSYLKIYGDYLGLDGRAISDQYARDAGGIQRHLPQVEPNANSPVRAPERLLITPPMIGFAILIIALLIGVVATNWWRGRNPTPKTTATKTSPQAPREFFAEPRLNNDIIPLPSHATDVVHVLSVEAYRPLRVKVIADGQTKFDGQLAAGKSQEFAAKQFRLELSDSAAANVAFDGKWQARLGRDGEPVAKDFPPPGAAR